MRIIVLINPDYLSTTAANPMKREYEDKSRKYEITKPGEWSSLQLIHEVSCRFEREPQKQHLVYSLFVGDYDWKALETSPYNPMVRLHPPGGSMKVFVYFKRDNDTPDLEWNERFRKLPVRRA